MNKEDIVRMARESCDTDKVDAWHNGFWTLTQEEIERFFQLAYNAGAAAEREACAKVCEGVTWEGPWNDAAINRAAAIRARGNT